jgi:threonine/homoserine/homoserine lactone efflux protein
MQQRHGKQDWQTYAMSTWILAIAFGPKLVALITRATDSPPNRRRRRVFADHGPRFGEGIAHGSRLEAWVVVAVELILGAGKGVSEWIGCIVLGAAAFSRQLQLFQDVLRTLGERV